MASKRQGRFFADCGKGRIFHPTLVFVVFFGFYAFLALRAAVFPLFCRSNSGGAGRSRRASSVIFFSCGLLLAGRFFCPFRPVSFPRGSVFGFLS